MARMQGYDQINALWAQWQSCVSSRPDDPPQAVLADILRASGTRLSSQEIAFALSGAGPDVMKDRARFADCMVALLGDPPLRLRHALGALGTDADQRIAKTDLLTVMAAFAVPPEEAALTADEIDADGDGRISLKDVERYLGDAPPPAPEAYRATHLPDHHLGASPSPAIAPGAAPARRPNPPHDEDAGLSPLQLRTGFFRLMQGAAYRSFRENYSANSETHLRARDLPYTIEDFARFTTATIDYYLSLGIVTDPGCIREFRRLDAMVQDELARLRERIRTWPTVEKTDGMIAAQGLITRERDGLARRQGICRAVMEFILTLRLHGLTIDQAGADALDRHEINRLRHDELRRETHRAPAVETATGAGANYLDSWNRVILTASDSRLDGAIMPTRFWYEDFMPQLLLCASLTGPEDLHRARNTTERELDDWHANLASQGVFNRFATDLRDGFAGCSPPVKQMLQQAWTLTAPYLTGAEKLRERAEFGRDSGFLSEYVAFVDVPLGRSDVERADMRLSFPYYIGPAVWGLLHGSAELVEQMPPADRQAALDRFVAFFRSFAAMYPCPYCRYHLNRYVIRNREIDMYPVEFLLLGRGDEQHDTAITLDQKLSTVFAPGGLRIFLWKLHNAVSSSIARTEPWYHRQPKPLYTSRFWPNIESEMVRAEAGGHAAISVDRVIELYAITKPTARLAVLRDELREAVRVQDDAALSRTIDRADDAIADLVQAMTQASYLTRKYAYDPGKQETPRPADAQEEDYARSGMFIER